MSALAGTAGHMRELAALACIMAHFWLRVVPRVRTELRAWDQLARGIPDPVLRRHALDTLRGERFSAMGAALVATTVGGCRPELVRLLVGVQVAWDYIDTLAEQPAAEPVANGVQLHRALVDALGPGPPRDDYYRLLPGRHDGGYLLSIVEACRAACAALPAYTCVAATVEAELIHAEVQYLNHGRPDDRAAALQAWAKDRCSEREDDAGWIELAAAASSSLGVLALLALAADRATTPHTVAALRSAYVPWVDALTALLDSFVDRPEDEAGGLMNWMANYRSDAEAGARLREATARAVEGVRKLPRPDRHMVIVTGMIAMHLSRPSAWRPGVRATTRAVLTATGSAIMPLLLLVLATWRFASRLA